MTELDDDIPLTDDERAQAQRGAALIAAAMSDPAARAPQGLRDALQRAERPRARPRRWLVAPGLAAVCLLVAGLVVALGGPDDGARAPSVRDVALVTRLPARHAAPARSGGAQPRLRAAVDGLAFPDWQEAFGWRATGRRADRIGGRAVTTVFYRYSERRILGYAIVAGPPLRPATGRDVVRGAARYRVVTRAGRTTVTWTQGGHTCVIDAPATVPAHTLVTLADWANA
jgi:hypothetical protein